VALSCLSGFKVAGWVSLGWRSGLWWIDTSTSTAPKAVLVTASFAAGSALKNFGVVGGPESFRDAGFFNVLLARAGHGRDSWGNLT